MNIVLIGGGVANCILARSLSGLPHVNLCCLESVQKGDRTDSGTGLNIGPNAMKALKLHDPDLHNRLMARGYPWESWAVSLTNGRSLFHLRLSDLAENPGLRIRWSELYRTLREAAGDSVRYGARVTRVAYMAGRGGKLVVNYNQDGVTHEVDDIDLVICGDGRYSIGRELLMGHPRSRMFGVVIGRLLTRDSSGGLIGDYAQWFNGSNRLLAFTLPGGYVYIVATTPIPEGAPIPESIRSSAGLRDLYTPSDGVLCPSCHWLVDQLCSRTGEMHWSRFQAIEAIHRDPGGHVLFLGDAAHAMLPTLGQGASQAIEDACVAQALVKRHLIHNKDAGRLPETLDLYGRLRHKRLNFVMDFSVEAADTLLAGSDPIAGSLRKLGPMFQQQLKRMFCDVTDVSGIN